jgi:hypothetical protein
MLLSLINGIFSDDGYENYCVFFDLFFGSVRVYIRVFLVFCFFWLNVGKSVVCY